MTLNKKKRKRKKQSSLDMSAKGVTSSTASTKKQLSSGYFVCVCLLGRKTESPTEKSESTKMVIPSSFKLITSRLLFNLKFIL